MTNLLLVLVRPRESMETIQRKNTALLGFFFFSATKKVGQKTEKKLPNFRLNTFLFAQILPPLNNNRLHFALIYFIRITPNNGQNFTFHFSNFF